MTVNNKPGTYVCAITRLYMRKKYFLPYFRQKKLLLKHLRLFLLSLYRYFPNLTPAMRAH